MRRIAIFMIIAVLATTAATSNAGEMMGGGCGRPTAHGPCCCDHPCVECAPFLLKKSCEEEKKTCWTTRCKQVEIPPVRFPWEKSDCCGCEPPLVKCGKVRTVRTLWQNEYKEPTPKYEWIRTCLKSCIPGCSSAPATDQPPVPSAVDPGAAPVPPQPIAEPPVSAGVSRRYDIVPSGHIVPVLLPALTE
ncbi:hypothetical protein [Blastopirellula retiformator]|uniref:Uncharacterized protein n=1 Tax=Blastopirellula retiformator TaxID=2527970 RepID=A0A5C5VA03_9BACT|nr:hypothetical protein [Blastopirellula retiformator]TWT34783.1 hypothetical protein Enr8_21970 [Blastopirellula retiformator]